MNSQTPIVKKISWGALAIQFLVIGAFTYLFHLLNFEMPYLFGGLAYSLLALVLRKSIAKNHRWGITLSKQGKFKDAIPFFEKSVAYFAQKSWVDKSRYLTLLSASGMGYKEMGLCNIAFCYSQIGNGIKSKEYYEKVLAEFPNSALAITSLRMLQATVQY